MYICINLTAMIKGLFFILLFYFIGECCSYLINGVIPGSVLGMIFLFLALLFKIINPENVRQTAQVITKNMAIFFVPAGVGIMTYYELLSNAWPGILTAIFLSTLLVIISVAFIQEYMEKRSGNRE
jgi:holin-like protein